MQKQHLKYALMAFAAVLFFGVLLSLCSSRPAAYVAPPIAPAATVAAPAIAAAPAVLAAPAAAAPVIINAPAPASSGVGDMLVGGALGYMAGSAMNRNNVQHAAPAPAPRPIINRTVVHKTVVVQRPAPRPFVRQAARPAPTRYSSSPARVSLRKR